MISGMEATLAAYLRVDLWIVWSETQAHIDID